MIKLGMIKLGSRMIQSIVALREAPAFPVFCDELKKMSEEMVSDFMSDIPDANDVNAQKREDVMRGVAMTLYTLSNCFSNPEEALEHIRMIEKEIASLPNDSSI